VRLGVRPGARRGARGRERDGAAVVGLERSPCYDSRMSLREYRDDAIEAEVGGRFGAYVRSFALGTGIVEIHVFEASNGELVAYVTKSPGYPMDLAHQLADEALVIVAQGPTRLRTTPCGSSATAERAG